MVSLHLCAADSYAAFEVPVTSGPIWAISRLRKALSVRCPNQ